MSRFLPALAFAAVTTLATSANADVIDPREDACRDKKEGDPCEVDGGDSGHCKKSSCSRLDYSDGVPPKTKSYDCFICEEGAAPAVTPDGAEAPADGQESKEEAKDKPTGSATPSEASANSEKKGCSVGASGTSLASFGLGLLLLGWVARRRYR